MQALKLFTKAAIAWMVFPTLGLTQAGPSAFVIDSTKDYAYLKFDHVGLRKKLPGDTTNKGLWIRLINNSQVPLVIATFDPGTGDTGVGVYDDVVPFANRAVSFHLGGVKTGVSRSAAIAHRPHGYSLPDVFSTSRITPGGSILFSVPVDHVGSSWSMQIRFYLAPARDTYGAGPYSVLSFDLADIPEQAFTQYVR